MAALHDLLDADQAEIRRRVRAVLSRKDFVIEPDLGLKAQRETALRRLKILAAEGFGALGLPQEHGGADDLGAFFAAFETIATHDISLAIKFTVHFGLWAGSVFLLGTKKHHERCLRDIGTFALPGCFAMTEIGHGSNVRDLETTARFDPLAGQFVLDSPTWTAGKNYIGNAGCDGHAAAVFAQLEVEGEQHGVHAFIVPLRNAEGTVLPGIRICDNGPKMGENGVDNARIWFKDVRIDRNSLLDRFGSVNAEGRYVSPLPDAAARFFAMISALVGGRISIALAGLSAAKVGLTIAVRYAAVRRQFRAKESTQEIPLLDYPTHRRRLLPLVAGAYALDFALKHLVALRLAAKDPREIELLAAALKAFTTWNTTATLQTCRETCGGEGYLTVNRLPALKADADIFTTFEGDNTVLMSWVGRSLARYSPGAVSAPPETQLDLAACRRLLVQRERALQSAGAKDASAFAALAHAYVERVVVYVFAERVANAEAPLAALAELFALGLIQRHCAWFLEEELLTAAITRQIDARIGALCDSLAANALELVDAFSIVPNCVAAPIALGAAASPDPQG